MVQEKFGADPETAFRYVLQNLEKLGWGAFWNIKMDPEGKEITLELHNSNEAYNANIPSCYHIEGILRGIGKAILGEDIVVREIDCIAKGDKVCKFIIGDKSIVPELYDQETIEIGQNIIDYVYEDFYSHENYRGGRYLVGFWSMSNHVAFGTLSGALPNGRRAFEPFTPGLTPVPAEKDVLIENIRSVASLNTDKMPNNLAFNVKLVPHPGDSHKETINYFQGYTQSYFNLGGMQMQYNVVSSDTLRDAMENPENYGWLMVRISGYNAYFVELNKDLQLELIRRTEFLTH